MNRQITRKKKDKNFMKVTAIAVLAIGLFSAAFLGINELAFAASTNGVENIPLMASVDMPTVPAPPEGFQSPKIAVIDDIQASYFSPAQRRANALSAEEAAEIGAQYIWELFGESIDGTVLVMTYTHWPNSTRSVWVGSVLEPEGIDVNTFTQETFDPNVRRLFSFNIDSVTGMRMDMFADSNFSTLAGISELCWETVVSGAMEPTFTTHPGHETAAREFAQRHFNASTVVDIQFQAEMSTPLVLDQDVNGNIFATDYSLKFYVTDNTGRTAELVISMQTGQLLFLWTSHNDVIPGFQFTPSADAMGW